MRAWQPAHTHPHGIFTHSAHSDLLNFQIHGAPADRAKYYIEYCEEDAPEGASYRLLPISKAESTLASIWKERLESEREPRRTTDLVETAALARQVKDLTAQVAALSSKVDELATRLEIVEGPPPHDSATLWRESNPADLARYRGMQIAVHPERGVIASAEDFATLFAEVKRLGLINEVVFDSVSDQ